MPNAMNGTRKSMASPIFQNACEAATKSCLLASTVQCESILYVVV